MSQTTVNADRPGLAVVLASVREGRFGPVVASWVMTQVAEDKYFRPTLLDLAQVGPEAPELAQAIDEATAVLIVTPEYNHSFPGQLKTAIDALGTEWRAKPVGFVSYGGLSGGLRSVEALRLVLGELDAVPLRNTVSLHTAPALFDDNGHLIEPSQPEQALAGLFDALAWWGATLRDGLLVRPFGSREAVIAPAS